MKVPGTLIHAYGLHQRLNEDESICRSLQMCEELPKQVRHIITTADRVRPAFQQRKLQMIHP